MKLNEYPNAIAKLSRKLNRMDIEVRHCQNLLEQANTQIERTIATDLDLKNDQQRKAKRLELMAEPIYSQTASTLQTEQTKRDLTAIDLQLLRDNFRIATLEFRHTIAVMERDNN
jgi:hypothetical protein